MNVQINSDELKTLKEKSEILTRLVCSEQYIERKYVEIIKQMMIEKKVEEIYDTFIDDLNDVLAEADVDQPAGRGCGYAISFDEAFVKHLLKNLVSEIKEIGNE